VILHIGDFEMEDDEDEHSVPGRHSYRIDDKTEAMLGKVRRKHMMRYKGEHQHVHIDSLREDTSPAIRDVYDTSKYRIGLVVNYSPVKKMFQIQPVRDNGVPETDDHLWPWLNEGVNFHRLKDLEGLEVTIHKPAWRGEVENWVPGPHGGQYDVKVLGAPTDVVRVSRFKADTGRSHMWHRLNHESGNMSDLVHDQLLLTLKDGAKVRGELTAYDDDALRGIRKFHVSGVQINKDGGKSSPGSLIVDKANVRELQVLRVRDKGDTDSDSVDSGIGFSVLSDSAFAVFAN
jgi:hypothetical protein